MDSTEEIRRSMVGKINSQVETNDEALERIRLEKTHGKVWNTNELTEEFEVTGFMAPFVGVCRKSDGKKGLMSFQHHPRFYFDFTGE